MSANQLNSILYVEDDPDIQLIGQLALGQVGGYSLHAFSSGSEAIKAVVGGLVPDLIVLDVMMPGMDGPSTLAQLRKLANTAGTPVIFMTAKVQANEVAHYKSLGALDVISKPFDPMQLADDVRVIWEARRV